MAASAGGRLGATPDVSYGHLFGEPKELLHLQGTGRSGLSPTYFSAPNQPLFPDDATRPLYEAERMYQKLKLAGYTSSTLQAMGCLEKEDLQAPNLTNGVHPIFDLAMWAPESVTKPGYDARNPLIWNAILPSLQLASKILENVHCWPWWDALMYGDQKWLDEEPGGPLSNLWSFHTRPPNVVFEEGFQTDEDFVAEYSGRIGFVIDMANSEWKMPATGQVIHADTMGYTRYLPPFNRSVITLAAQAIMPLLEDFITDSQRILVHFQLAKTILHELAHAIGYVLNADEGILEFGEPFFERETLRELGESMETAVCGGRIWSYPSALGSRAFMVSTVANWPNYVISIGKAEMGLEEQIMPGSGARYRVGDEAAVMAIPISWIESLFQEDFWQVYVRQYGGAALRPYPRLLINTSTITELGPGGRARRTQGVRHGEGIDEVVQARKAADGGALDVEMGGTELPGEEAWVVAARAVDAQRTMDARRQVEILEQAIGFYGARTGIFMEA